MRGRIQGISEKHAVAKRTVGTLIALCLAIVVVGCDGDDPGASPDVSDLRQATEALCDRYVECGLEFAVEEHDDCVSGSREEMDRLVTLTGGSCQSYVDGLTTYYSCLVAVDCAAFETDDHCADESTAFGELVETAAFDCDGL